MTKHHLFAVAFYGVLTAGWLVFAVVSLVVAGCLARIAYGIFRIGWDAF